MQTELRPDHGKLFKVLFQENNNRNYTKNGVVGPEDADANGDQFEVFRVKNYIRKDSCNFKII